MGKASRTKQDGDRRARIAAQREAERRAAQRKRIYLAGGSILVVAIVVVALVLVKLNSGSGTAAAASNGPTGAALSTLTKQVEDVPTSVTDAVAGGGVSKSLFVPTETSTEVSNASSEIGSYFGTVNSTTPLTSGGKPEVLYMGAEYCPYCAAQRWAMVNALSRFGTFTGLTTTHSSSTDADPNTPTWTFYGSTYKSNYINFTSVEETKNYRIGNSSSTSVNYVTLQTPTTAQQNLAQQYDPGSGSGSPIPFIDLGNKYVQVGNLSPLSPTLLAGKTWAQVGAAMNDPSSALGQAEIGNANYMTAGICKLTNNLPATACTPTIQKLEANFAS
jgi:thiol-disulfide isomerase/thioredoxin